MVIYLVFRQPWCLLIERLGKMSTSRNSSILWIVEKLVEESTRLPGNPKPKRRGGYLTVIVRGEPEISLCAVVGSFINDAKEYLVFSQEKAKRLRTLSRRHVLSSQSRNPDKNRWGGAISAGLRIISFSGLPELVDEAVVTAAAYWLGEITEYEQALRIAEISQNPFTEELIARMANWPTLAELENFSS
jgi:hypothetical protein